MSSMITNAMKQHTRGKSTAQTLWVLQLLPLPGDTEGNEYITSVLTDIIHETGLSVAQILNQESTRAMPRWFDPTFQNRIPNYRQFLRYADRLEDGGRFLNQLARYEEELLYQANYAQLHDIVEDRNRDLRKTEFNMRMKMTGQLMKRRKDKGEVQLTETQAEQSALSRMTNEQLQALNKMIDVTPDKEKADE